MHDCGDTYESKMSLFYFSKGSDKTKKINEKIKKEGDIYYENRTNTRRRL